MGFSFTATAQCDFCGAYLSSSDEECDHDGYDVERLMFRRIGSGQPKLITIEATKGHMWYKLKKQVGEDWIAYEYLGPHSWVKKNTGSNIWPDVEDIPKRSMSIDAPDDVSEEE